MKSPQLIDLSETTASDPFSQAISDQKARSSGVVRKTFSLEQQHLDYLLKVATEAMQTHGRTVSASEALRIVIERDRARQ